MNESTITKERNEETTVISISKHEYDMLHDYMSKFFMLRKSFMRASNHLYMKNTEIGFDDRILNLAFEVTCPEEYEETMDRLKREGDEE